MKEAKFSGNRVKVVEPCQHVRGNFLVPGWGCCRCRCYNGYQRTNCRNCGHPPCYETSSLEGHEALELQKIGGNPDLVGRWLAARIDRAVRPLDRRRMS